MNSGPRETARFGVYEGAVAAPYASADLVAWLSDVGRHASAPSALVLTAGRNRNAKVDAVCGGRRLDVAVKSFGPPSALGSARSRIRGSKARRTYEAAVFLAARGVGTPAPVAFAERWDRGRLVESHFVSAYCGGVTTFKDELIRLFRHDPECARFMDLLQAVADAVRAMHAAGFQHNDLGNQNILLRRDGAAGWRDVMFVDLNRGRRHPALTPRQRARDISRIHLPSDLLRVFREMCEAPLVPSRAFLRWERLYRRLYALHTRTRRLRHPLRPRAPAGGEDATYPEPKDLWIWDERSGQAIAAMTSAERRRHYPWLRHAAQVCAVARDALPVWRRYRALMASAYGAPVAMDGRVAVAVSGAAGRLEREMQFLRLLGPVPVHLRFYHHASEADRAACASSVKALRRAGHPVSIALVQDRLAVRDPARWGAFVGEVLERVGRDIEWAEVGHAINRVKWGLWSLDEYAALAAAAAGAVARFPSVRLTGPAAIDFEYPFVLAALRRQPAGVRLWALSHHLYVDRRGAPENRQGVFATLEKAALARAMAGRGSACEDRLVISEVNWPLLGTGVHSPVGSPYESPGVRRNDPSVSEDDYADFMLRYLLTTICSGMAERVVWWQLAAHGYGLVDDRADPWRARPALAMLATFVGRMRGARFVERLPHAVAGDAEILRFERAGGAFSVAYAPRGAAVYRPASRPRQVCDAFGATLGGASGDVRLGGRPVYIED